MDIPAGAHQLGDIINKDDGETKHKRFRTTARKKT
jgi:hypothetical protein